MGAGHLTARRCQPRQPGLPRRRLAIATLLLLAGLLAACSSTRSSSPPAPPATPTTPNTTATSSTATAPSATGPTPTTPPAAGSTAAWATYYGNAGRSGVDTTAPSAQDVHVAWTSPVLDGAVYAQPLVADGTVYVATENNTVYAFDSTSGRQQWVRHLGTPVPGSDLPCGNINPSGITGTPVAEVARRTLWVVTFTVPGRHTLWGLDLATGAVTSQRPADPQGSDPLAQQERGALALDGSSVYVPYGGLYGDCSDYHGWVLGLSAAHPTDATATTYETPTQLQAGIWAPPGPVVAPDGDLFVATGNGMPYGTVDDSDSVVKLSPTLAVLGTFTPSNFEKLSADDLDLGSTSPVLLPGGLVFQIGKGGTAYVMSEASPGGPGGELTSDQACSGAAGGAVADGSLVVVSCYHGLQALRVSVSAGENPTVTAAWSADESRTGPPIVAGGYVWAVGTDGTLRGYNEGSGDVSFSFPIDVEGDFPSPAAVGSWLFAPDGDRVEAFDGV